MHGKKFNANTFCSWDCHWYTLISKAGYMSKPILTGALQGQANWAFFPLEPLVVRFFSNATSIDTILVAEVLGNLFLLGGLLYLSAYLGSRFSAKHILITSVLISFSPVNVYFTSFYTEALYFFLFSAFLYYIHENEWLVSGIFANLILISRMTGLVVIPIFIYSFYKSANRNKGKNREFIFSLFFIPLGLLVFMYSLYKKNGDPVAFYNVQKYWLVPENPFRWVIHAYQSGDLQQIGFMSVLIGSVLISIHFYRKQMYMEFFLLASVCAVSLTSNRYHYRFTLGIYPIYLFAASLVSRSKWLFVALFASELVLLVVAINSWIIGHGPI
jgi:hypothetical protein